MNNNIIIGAGEEHLSLFRNELPGLTYINFPGFRPGYSRFFPQYISLLFKIPVLMYHIIQEHYRLKKIIAKYDVDIVISDNRFGLWNTNVTTVYITHMPLIPFPPSMKLLEPIGVLIHRRIIKKYNFCFIPDLPGDLNLSGRLSHSIKLPDNVRYIGILSKFMSTEQSPENKPVKFRHNTVILSGPEPQRKILKQKLVTLLIDKEPYTVFFEGKPENKNQVSEYGNIIFYNHLRSVQMKEIIGESDIIISRSGYTTIMELVSLGCSAIIIPTPGQTEQEYLADYLSEKGWFKTFKQSEIKAGISLTLGKIMFTDEINRQSSNLLTAALNELLEKCHNEN